MRLAERTDGGATRTLDEESSGLERELLEIESQARELEPALPLRRQWGGDAQGAIDGFIDDLGHTRTFKSCDDDISVSLDGTGGPGDGSAVIEQLHAALTSSGLVAAGPGHLGFIPGGGLYAAALADYLAAGYNFFTADAFASPAGAAIHNESVRWLCNVVGYGAAAWGDLTSGGSLATVSALAAARTVLDLPPAQWERGCIYVGEHTHHSLHKAIDLLFARALRIRTVPNTRDFRMDTAELEARIKEDLAAGLVPLIVAATAGSTNLGKIDPLREISRICRDHHLWFHVDAAYGGFFRLCETAADLLDGLDAADSVVLDPHKGLFLPYGCGAVLVKDGSALSRTFHYAAPYLQDREAPLSQSPMDCSPELTRPFRALRLWMCLKIHGRDAIAASLEEKLLLAQYCASRLKQNARLSLCTDVDLSVLAFSVNVAGRDPNALTKLLLRRINAHEEVFLSSTLVGERFVIRIAILSFRTHLDRVKRLLEIIERELDELVNSLAD